MTVVKTMNEMEIVSVSIHKTIFQECTDHSYQIKSNSLNTLFIATFTNHANIFAQIYSYFILFAQNCISLLAVSVDCRVAFLPLKIETQTYMRISE